MATVGGSGGYAITHTGIKVPKGKIKSLSVRAVDGTTVFSRDRLLENWKTIERGRDALSKLSDIVSQPPKNKFKELQAYRSLAKAVIRYQFIYQDFVDACTEEIDRIVSGTSDRSRKRWTDDEDSVLIEMAAQDHTATEIAIMLGRSPGAIQTRLSYLVGVNRVSSQIAGRFVGWLDGEQVEGDIDGVVTKDARK